MIIIAFLEVTAQPLHFCQHEVDVGLVDSLVGDDAAEEVGVTAQGLVAHHDGSSGHHAAFQLGSHLRV